MLHCTNLMNESPWIKFSDRNPPLGTNVIAGTQDCIGFKLSYHVYRYDGTTDGLGLTHWQPIDLTPPPKPDQFDEWWESLPLTHEDSNGDIWRLILPSVSRCSHSVAKSIWRAAIKSQACT